MGQGWLNRAPSGEQSALQMGLFEGAAEGGVHEGYTESGIQISRELGGTEFDADDEDCGWLNAPPEKNRDLLQMSLFGVEEGSEDDGLSGDQTILIRESQSPLMPQMTHEASGRKGKSSQKKSENPESDGPELDLNDESLVYFRSIGVRSLFSEMVIQSIRDRVCAQDEKRMARLRARDPQACEEIKYSADWLSTKEGSLAVQMLYPDWDHVTIIRRIHEDPKGVLARMESAGALHSKDKVEIAQGFDEMPIRDDSGFSDRMDGYDVLDADSESFSLR